VDEKYVPGAARHDEVVIPREDRVSPDVSGDGGVRLALDQVPIANGALAHSHLFRPFLAIGIPACCLRILIVERDVAETLPVRTLA
jgi:hypothetical protein